MSWIYVVLAVDVTRPEHVGLVPNGGQLAVSCRQCGTDTNPGTVGHAGISVVAILALMASPTGFSRGGSEIWLFGIDLEVLAA